MSKRQIVKTSNEYTKVIINGDTHYLNKKLLNKFNKFKRYAKPLNTLKYSKKTKTI